MMSYGFILQNLSILSQLTGEHAATSTSATYVLGLQKSGRESSVLDIKYVLGCVYIYIYIINPTHCVYAVAK